MNDAAQLRGELWLSMTNLTRSLGWLAAASISYASRCSKEMYWPGSGRTSAWHSPPKNLSGGLRGSWSPRLFQQNIPLTQSL